MKKKSILLLVTILLAIAILLPVSAFAHTVQCPYCRDSASVNCSGDFYNNGAYTCANCINDTYYKNFYWATFSCSNCSAYNNRYSTHTENITHSCGIGFSNTCPY